MILTEKQYKNLQIGAKLLILLIIFSIWNSLQEVAIRIGLKFVKNSIRFLVNITNRNCISIKTIITFRNKTKLTNKIKDVRIGKCNKMLNLIQSKFSFIIVPFTSFNFAYPPLIFYFKFYFLLISFFFFNKTIRYCKLNSRQNEKWV